MKYNKPALASAAQIARLQALGLVVANIKALEDALAFIGQFRLKGYFLPFMHVVGGVRQFLPGTTFDQIIDIYQFDRKLRLLLLDEIERLEVAIRTVICNRLSEVYSPHWYVTHPGTIFDLKNFQLYAFLSTWDKDARRDKSPFTTHYYHTYTDPPIPPSWVIAECITFGKWSLLYQKLQVEKIQIAKPFGLPSDVFESWLHSLTVVRNACAHHARVWNKGFAIQPKAHKLHKKHFVPPSNRRVYALLVIIRIMTRAIDPGSSFPASLKALCATRTPAQMQAMGFINRWDQDSTLW